jgi:hypothetical protein
MIQQFFKFIRRILHRWTRPAWLRVRSYRSVQHYLEDVQRIRLEYAREQWQSLNAFERWEVRDWWQGELYCEGGEG